MATRYWVVSLPVQNSASSIWNQLQEQISKHSFDTPLYRFNIPNLRVGTLDSLLSLSDDLVKSNSFVEGVTHKIRRQIEEMERLSGVESNALTVDGVPLDSYLTRFLWDEAKYPTMAPLREIVDSIHSQVTKIEDDLKVRVAEYNTVRSQLNAITQKQSGSLAVRDLTNLVKPEDIITSEHLVTLFAIVSKYSQKDWSIILEQVHVIDVFKIRDFEYSSEAQQSRKQELEKLMQDQERLRNSLLQWCYTSYGEACVLAPSVRSEKKVQSILEGLCDSANSSYWKTNDEIGGMVGLAADTDVHPYVCFTINLV